MKIASLFVAWVFPLLFYAQSVRFVNINSTSVAPDGFSWSTAYHDLHQALAVAQNGDEIWITQGVYKPAQNGDRWKTFILPSGVALYGGFSGTEVVRDQRNWVANQTILSGDIGVPGDSTDNSYGILYASNTNELTSVDGITIEEANANNSDINTAFFLPSRSGAGIYLNGFGQGSTAHLKISNCTIRSNRANYQGGGIFANGRNGGHAIVRLDNCLIEKNRAGYYGGGVVVENTSVQTYQLEVNSCIFSKNRATVSGCAVWLYTRQAIVFSDCLFSEHTQPGAGAVAIEGDNLSLPILFQRCDFHLNKNWDIGSAIYFRVYSTTGKLPIQIIACNFNANTGTPLSMYGSNSNCDLGVFNCIFHSNLGDDNSGVVSWSALSAISTINFINCLFYKNWGREFSGSLNSLEMLFRVQNSILINEEEDGEPYISANKVELTNCLVSHNNCSDLSYISSGGSNVTCTNTLFAANPQFINPTSTSDADFHLEPCSPAINAGNNDIVDSLDIQIDFDGNQRTRYGHVDIGPYEINLLPNQHEISHVTCANGNDGSILFEPNLCPPFTILWDGGSISDLQLFNLSAGNYVFTFTDANGISFTDIVKIEEPAPIHLIAETIEISCHGYSDGIITLMASGGMPPYHYPQGNPISNLNAGLYSFVISDSNGCTGSINNVILTEPPPIEIIYSVFNASGPNAFDGAILIDTVIGGTGVITSPPDLTNLQPGSFIVSVIDINNCSASDTIEVGYTVNTNEQTGDFDAVIFPNPTTCHGFTFIKNNEDEGGSLFVFDFSGKKIAKITVAPQSLTPIRSVFPAGLYLIEFYSDSGKKIAFKWLIQ